MEIRMNWEQLLSTETQVKREVEPEDFAKYPMDDLEKDYKAIISSAAFRRLQDKTQVFPLDKSDFVRTRLTHSLEVSTIARQLGIMITRNATGYLPDDFKNKDGKDKLVEIVLEELNKKIKRNKIDTLTRDILLKNINSIIISQDGEVNVKLK